MGDEGWRLRHAGRHDDGDGDIPGAFQLLGLGLPQLTQPITAVIGGELGGCLLCGLLLRARLRARWRLRWQS